MEEKIMQLLNQVIHNQKKMETTLDEIQRDLTDIKIVTANNWRNLALLKSISIKDDSAGDNIFKEQLDISGAADMLSDRINRVDSDINSTSNQLLLSLWDSILESLKVQIPEICYMTWFQNIIPLSVDESELILNVTNEFHRGILESKYNEILQDAIRKITGKDYCISFVTKGTSNNNSEILGECN